MVKEASARTLEFAYNDYCVAMMAKALGRERDYRKYLKRARNYTKVFDHSAGFFRGKNINGSWVPDFSPIEWGGPFTEGCAWHYLWSVQQDVPGLIKLLGGKETFVKKLDALFSMKPDFKVGSYKKVIHEMREMKAAGMGQYAHGNEPVHHVIYLYDYVGQPWKTQKRVREVMEKLYGPDPGGYLGDEDNGQMSAWYIFGALGFYPVCPGQPVYAIGSPLFPDATINLPGGRTFIILAVNNSKDNVYIQSAKLNGKPLDRPWLRHAEIINGGKLEFVMGPRPNKSWGSKPENAPPPAIATGE